MTTVDCLRAALTADAAQAATPDRVARVRAAALAAGRTAGRTTGRVSRPGGRSRRAALVAAAAALLLVVAGVSLGVRRLQADAVIPATGQDHAMPVTRYVFTVDRDPGGLSFQPAGTATGVQGGFWYRGSGQVAAAAVNVGTDGSAIGIRQRPAGATDVTVDGHPGWRAAHPDTAPAYFNLGETADATVWQDAGLWIELLTVRMSPTRIEQLARSLHPGRTSPVTFPARLTYLPADARLTATDFSRGVSQLVFGPHGQDFTLALGPAGYTTSGNIATPRMSVPGVIQTGGATGPAAAPQRLTIGQFTGTYRPDNPLTTLSNGRLDVTIGYGAATDRAMPLTELTRLVQGVQPIGTVTDPATWTTLDKALPAQP